MTLFPRNEYEVKKFIEKTESFTGGQIMLIVLWSTRNIKSLLPLKDKVAQRSCVIYEGKYSCKLRYIGETKGNSEVRWKEHEDPGGKSEPSKHLIENAFHKFTWKVLSIAPSHFHRREILETFFIALRKAALNDLLEHHLNLLCSNFDIFGHYSVLILSFL